MKTIFRLVQAFALLAAAACIHTPIAASAQNRGAEPGQNAPTAVTPNPPPAAREEFRALMKQYQGELEQLSKDVGDVSKKLENQSGASIETGKAQVDALRERLIQLGAQLQPDAPLAQNVDRFQSWISAQLGRVNGQRQSLGAEFVQQLIKRYQHYQQEVTIEREKISGGAKAIDSLLTELTIAELRISELLIADDAGGAVRELKRLVKSITDTIERIRTHIRAQITPPGV
jgi:chromosome segregation ATPase